jgi:hypothetical protein
MLRRGFGDNINGALKARPIILIHVVVFDRLFGHGF